MLGGFPNEGRIGKLVRVDGNMVGAKYGTALAESTLAWQFTYRDYCFILMLTQLTLFEE